MIENGKLFLFMGEGQHKIKRKAEQIACNEALTYINANNILVNSDSSMSETIMNDKKYNADSD
jgi:hypothetical protein